MEETQHADAVQVIDEAIPPARKAKPKRSLVVIGTTASAFLLSVALVLALAWLPPARPPHLGPPPGRVGWAGRSRSRLRDPSSGGSGGCSLWASP